MLCLMYVCYASEFIYSTIRFLKKCFTRVVKGHIALAKAVFPNKTKGNQEMT